MLLGFGYGNPVDAGTLVQNIEFGMGAIKQNESR